MGATTVPRTVVAPIPYRYQPIQSWVDCGMGRLMVRL